VDKPATKAVPAPSPANVALAAAFAPASASSAAAAASAVPNPGAATQRPRLPFLYGEADLYAAVIGIPSTTTAAAGTPSPPQTGSAPLPPSVPFRCVLALVPPTERERERERERGDLMGSSHGVETPLPSNSPHDHVILRVDLVDSHGSWKRPSLKGGWGAGTRWGAMQVALKAPSIAQLRKLFSELHPHHRHIGLDDLVDPRFAQEKRATGALVRLGSAAWVLR
jgi:hypothetical protein